MQRQQALPAHPGQRGSSERRWRRAKLVAGSLAVAIGSFGTLTAVTALPASAASVTSSNFIIGSPTGGVNAVSVTPVSTVQSGANVSFTVSFTATAAIASAGSITVTPSVALGSAPINGSLVDLTSSACLQSGFNGGSSTTTSVTFILMSSCSIASGDKVQASFNASAPASTVTTYTFGVSTSVNATVVSSNTITNTSTPPVLAASGHGSGANVVYTITQFGAANGGLTASTGALVLTASCSLTCTATPPTIAWSNSGAGGYSVTYTPSGGTATGVTLSSVTLSGSINCTPTASPPTLTGCNVVTLGLNSLIPTGATVTITGTGTNPPGSSTSSITIAPFASVGGVTTGTPETTNTITFGSSVTNVTLTASPAVSSASATYTVTFRATSAVAAGGTIALAQPNTGFANVTGWLVTDITANWHIVGNTAGVAGNITLTLTGQAIAAGDTLTVTVAGVTNPTNGTYSNFTVATSVDTVPAAAPPYIIGPSGAAGVIVTPNPASVGAISTYTVTNLFATAAFVGGSSTIGIVANTTTTRLPNNQTNYTITDITTPSGSGTASAVSGFTGNSITITVPNAINNGDQLVLTISSIINPGTASSTNTMTFSGNLTGPSAVAPFPPANSTFPNGGLINFSGAVYVFAGGKPFGIPTQAVLTKIRSVNHAVVLNAAPGSTLPVVASSRSGTLITTQTVSGNPTIYVVGTDGQLHGFSTPQQLKSTGYDARLNVTVSNLGGMTVGSTVGVEGSAASAFATSADGAIVNSSGTVYTFAGGRAFGIPTPASLTRIRKTNSAAELSGTVTTTQTGAAVASGVLFSVIASTTAIVYVSYVGNIFPFRTPTQLKNLGYGGTAAVPVPNTGGIPVVAG
jgi:large repetitive protein